MNSKIKTTKGNGFSIIEILIILVIVGIVGVIGMVVYTGLTKKAIVTTIQSDLIRISSQLKAEQLANGKYPTSLEAVKNGSGVISNSNTEYQYEYNNSTTLQTFCVTAIKNSTKYKVTNSSSPSIGSCPGYLASAYLDAGNQLSYPNVGTTWSDLSTNKFDITLHNNVKYDTSDGGVLVFDGIDGYASKNVAGTFISDPALNSYKLSYSLWVNVLSSNSFYIISSGSQSASTGVTLSYQAGGPFYSITGSTKSASSTISGFELNKWINWTVTSDWNGINLYKNGELQSSKLYKPSENTDTYTDLTIGTPNNAIGNYMTKMKIGSLIIYDRTLTAQEVQQNFNANRSRYGI